MNLPVTWLLKTNAGCFLENYTFPRNSLIVAITFKVWLIRVLKMINEAPKVCNFEGKAKNVPPQPMLLHLSLIIVLESIRKL